MHFLTLCFFLQQGNYEFFVFFVLCCWIILFAFFAMNMVASIGILFVGIFFHGDENRKTKKVLFSFAPMLHDSIDCSDFPPAGGTQKLCFQP